jgi:wobble nucleotide-excising tRNase
MLVKPNGLWKHVRTPEILTHKKPENNDVVQIEEQYSKKQTKQEKKNRKRASTEMNRDRKETQNSKGRRQNIRL